MSAAKKSKNTFADMTDDDYQIFMEYTDISLRQAKEVFSKLHAENPDGNLNKAEFAAFFKSIDPDACKLKQYSEFTDMIFKGFDEDHDDILTVKELLIGFAVITKGDPNKRLNYIFSIYDTDGNNALTKDEVKNGFKGVFIMGGVDPNDFMCEVSASNKLKKLDSDKDGKISRGELSR